MGNKQLAIDRKLLSPAGKAEVIVHDLLNVLVIVVDDASYLGVLERAINAEGL
jgi:hypothetical protein